MTDLRIVRRDRDSTKFEPHAARLTYQLADSSSKTFPATLRLFPIAFNVDWGGAVNVRYALPDARLNVRTTTTRLFRSSCRPLAEWQPVFARYAAARSRIEAMYCGVPDTDPVRLRPPRSFLNELNTPSPTSHGGASRSRPVAATRALDAP